MASRWALLGILLLALGARAADYRTTQLSDVVYKETLPGATLEPLVHSKPPPYEVLGNQAYQIHQRKGWGGGVEGRGSVAVVL